MIAPDPTMNDSLEDADAVSDNESMADSDVIECEFRLRSLWNFRVWSEDY